MRPPSDPRLIVAAALTLLAGCGGSTKSLSTQTKPPIARSQAPTGQVSPPGLSVHLSAPKSQPASGRLWPITVTAMSSSGAPVNATVSYQFLFGGAIVASRPGGHMRGGTFHDRLLFPARASGIALTLRVNVSEGGKTGSVERSVTVRR
jgi:hypothetical protein